MFIYWMENCWKNKIDSKNENKIGEMADSGLEQEMTQVELVHLVMPQGKAVLRKRSEPKPTLKCVCQGGTGGDWSATSQSWNN